MYLIASGYRRRGRNKRHTNRRYPAATAGRNTVCSAASARRSACSVSEKRWLWRHRRWPLGTSPATLFFVAQPHFFDTERAEKVIATCDRDGLASIVHAFFRHQHAWLPGRSLGP